VPARTYLIFGDIEGKLDVLRVECTKCSRKGRYRVGRLIEKYGPKANMMKWKEQLTIARGAMHIACTSAAIWYALTYLRFYDSTPEEEQGNYRAPVLARLAAAAARPSSRDCRGREGSRSRCRCAIRSERRAAQAACGASAGLRMATANLDREER
jgi:hypothetical protein